MLLVYLLLAAAIVLSAVSIVLYTRKEGTVKELVKSTSSSSGTLVYDMVSQASCMVMAQFSDGRSSGSGFCVRLSGSDAVYATATHVITRDGQTASNVILLINAQTQVACDIVAIDFASDVALLKTKGVNLLYVKPLQFAESAQIGETVYALGNPLANDIKSISEGIIRDNHFVSSTFSGSVECMLTTCSILSGNSGGCFVDASGKVLGMSNFCVRV